MVAGKKTEMEKSEDELGEQEGYVGSESLRSRFKSDLKVIEHFYLLSETYPNVKYQKRRQDITMPAYCYVNHNVYHSCHV